MSNRWTPEQARDFLTKRSVEIAAKTAKYRNRKTEVDGILFDSKKEAARYSTLKLMQEAGEISGLVLQVPFAIHVGKKHVGDYMADFVYATKSGQIIIEDVKSAATRTALYRFKKLCIEAQYNLTILET